MTPGPPAVVAREWAIAAEPIVERMREAVTRVVNAGVGRDTLAASSLLYEALLGYAYLGDCRKVIGDLPPPAPSQRELAGRFQRACASFVRASSLFTEAVETDRHAVLRTAAREALRGDVHVRRVAAALES